jgi:hypothetical protein
MDIENTVLLSDFIAGPKKVEFVDSLVNQTKAKTVPC